MSKQPSSRELVQTLRGRGVSNAEIAAELNVSPRMVRKVLNGESPGRNYAATLQELATTGRATTRPERRRRADGALVPVRTKRGAPTKSAPPPDTGGRYTKAKQGGRFTSETGYMGGGGRQHQLRIPKGDKAKGRQAANSDLITKIRAAARGQSADVQKRVRMQLTYANGRTMEVNDYNASSLLDRVKRLGDGDVLGFLTSQMKERYKNLDPSKTAITGVTMTVTNETRTAESSRPYAPRTTRR